MTSATHTQRKLLIASGKSYSWDNTSSIPEVTMNVTFLSNASASPLSQFSEWYEGIHGYISIVVCIFGIAANIMNILVLTRRGMITPTNRILTALATADLMTMLSYLPYAVYFHCLSAPHESYNHTQGWVIYLLFHTHFIITSHTAAMWLAVALALFRYIVVCHHTLGPRLCNLQRANVAIFLVFITTVIFCIPNYVIYRCVPRKEGGYWFEPNDFVTNFHTVFNFWLFGVVLKVAPCALLSVLSGLLIRAMQEARKRRSSLRSTTSRRDSTERSGVEKDRTTAMLLLVVLSFVVTELPQGILAFLSGVYDYIFANVYVPLGDVFDILVLINSSANFILYCIMSAQFRKTFREVFFLSTSTSSSNFSSTAPLLLQGIRNGTGARTSGVTYVPASTDSPRGSKDIYQ